jgi:hypothetical protein
MSQQRFNTAQIANLLAISRPYATDRKCIEAVKSLLCEYHLQIAEYKKGQRGVVDPLLMQGIGDWGRYIFAQANPEIALARFLGKREKPGKRAKNTDRDFTITGAVVAKMENGMTLEEASPLIAAEYKLKADTVRKIYVRRNKEVRAARHQII